VYSHVKHKRESPVKLKFGVVVVSTSRFQALRRDPRVKDLTGDLIEEKLRESKQEVVVRTIIPDDVKAIRETLENCLRKGCDVVIFAGGTGISKSDVTIEALKPLLEKELPGFGELFRMLSYREIGSAAMLTRCLAGVYRGAVIFAIPGSPHAAKLALESLILPEAGHLVKHARE